MRITPGIWPVPMQIWPVPMQIWPVPMQIRQWRISCIIVVNIYCDFHMNYLDEILAARTTTAQVRWQFSVAYPLIILCSVYRLCCMYVWICALCNRRPTREPRGWGSTKRFIPAAPQQNKYRTMLTIIKGSCPWKHAAYIFNRLLHTHSDYCEKKKTAKKDAD